MAGRDFFISVGDVLIDLAKHKDGTKTARLAHAACEEVLNCIKRVDAGGSTPADVLDKLTCAVQSLKTSRNGDVAARHLRVIRDCCTSGWSDDPV